MATKMMMNVGTNVIFTEREIGRDSEIGLEIEIVVEIRQMMKEWERLKERKEREIMRKR